MRPWSHRKAEKQPAACFYARDRHEAECLAAAGQMADLLRTLHMRILRDVVRYSCSVELDGSAANESAEDLAEALQGWLYNSCPACVFEEGGY